MNLRRATSSTNGLIVVMSALGLVFGAAGPASAVESAEGEGTGWEYIGPFVQKCGLDPAGSAFDYDYFELYFQSTYKAEDARASGSVAYYIGPGQMQITTAALVQAPQGAAPGGCNHPLLPLVPLPVPITEVYITGSSGSGEVECTGPVDLGLQVENFYERNGSAVVFEFTANCDITGNVIPGNVENQDMTHKVEGTQTPCQIPIVEPFVTGAETYVDNPECVALGGGKDGQASSHLVATFRAAGP